MLRALLAHTEEHGYVRDPRGRFLLASDVLARSLGYGDPEELVGEPVPDRVRVEEESAVLDEHGELVGFLGIAGDRATHAHRLHEIIATQRDVATADLDVEAMMGLLCERTMELTDADGATVALLTDGELRFGASRGSPDHPVGRQRSGMRTLHVAEILAARA
jgi:PAS domain-containing protein